MLVSNLALGVQACYRGPQLYDTERVKEMVKQWVGWYKEWRDILESDLIHGRRAGGRDLDWMLHVNPKLDTKGMLVVFNPLDAPVERELAVNLYYTGLEDSVTLHNDDEETRTLPIARNDTVRIPVSVPARGFRWYALR